MSSFCTDSLKYFDISIPQHIRFAEEEKINRTTTFHKCISNLTPEVGDVLKILWKKGEIAPQEHFFLLFHNILSPVLDFHVKTGTRFSD